MSGQIIVETFETFYDEMTENGTMYLVDDFVKQIVWKCYTDTLGIDTGTQNLFSIYWCNFAASEELDELCTHVDKLAKLFFAKGVEVGSSGQ